MSADRSGCAARPTLETERLRLRPPHPTDALAAERLVNDPEVIRFLATLPHPPPAGWGDQWIAELLEDPDTVFVLERKDQAGFIGAIGLVPEKDPQSISVGFWLGRDYWRQGFASEALAAAIDYAFERLGYERVEAWAALENRASRRVLEKAGLAVCGEGDEELPARGRTVRVERRRLTRAEWRARRPALPSLLVVAVALVDVDGRVLLAQRPPGKSMAGLWEFPGGKVHESETPEAALIRELREELGIDTADSCLAPIGFASHRYERFHLLMPLYACRVWQGDPTPREGQRLAWVRPTRLRDYPMPPADAPLIPLLQDLL